MFTQFGLCLVESVRVNDSDHTNPHIEDMIHFVTRDFSALLDQLEQRRNCPTSGLDFHADACGQNAGDVVEESAARNMRQCFKWNGCLDLLHKVEVAAVRREQSISEIADALELRIE